jgi:hypothetical protein
MIVNTLLQDIWRNKKTLGAFDEERYKKKLIAETYYKKQFYDICIIYRLKNQLIFGLSTQVCLQTLRVNNSESHKIGYF